MPLRALRSAAREFADVLRAATPTHRRLRDELVAIIVATVGVDLLCAIAAFVLERHSQQTDIRTFGSAAFWTTTQTLLAPTEPIIAHTHTQEDSWPTRTSIRQRVA